VAGTAELTGPITIEGVIVAEVGSPRNDGSRGAALYTVPLKLSRAPTVQWARFFVAAWDSPPRSTTRHRPGIASVVGDQIVLAGTTMEEIEHVHLTTLRLALEEANRQESDRQVVETVEAQRQAEVDQAHAAEVRATAGRLRFDADARDRIGPDDPMIVVSDLRVESIDPAAQAQTPFPPSPNQLVISIMNGGTGPGFQIEGNAHFSWSGGAWQALGRFDPIPALPAGVTVERRFRASAGAPWPSYVTADLVRIEGNCRDRRDQESPRSYGRARDPRYDQLRGGPEPIWEAENLASGFGETLGFTVEIERLTRHFGGQTEEMSLRATSLYRRENGAWRVIHRHGDGLMNVEIDPKGRR
jgi:hypothetical protein